jgi:hypothetical protein
VHPLVKPHAQSHSNVLHKMQITTLQTQPHLSHVRIHDVYPRTRPCRKTRIHSSVQQRTSMRTRTRALARTRACTHALSHTHVPSYLQCIHVFKVSAYIISRWQHMLPPSAIYIDAGVKCDTILNCFYFIQRTI